LFLFFLTYGDWDQLFFNLIFLKFSLSREISPAHGYITKTQYRNLAIFSKFLTYGDWNQLFSILLYFKFHLLAKLLQRDGYTLKTQYRNLAIFSFFFCHLWRLKPTFLEYIAFWRNFSRPWRK